MKHTFNTGRRYSADGQIIEMEITADGIRFKDTTRLVFGWFPLSFEDVDFTKHPEFIKLDLERLVLSRYDAGHFEEIAPY